MGLDSVRITKYRRIGIFKERVGDCFGASRIVEAASSRSEHTHNDCKEDKRKVLVSDPCHHGESKPRGLCTITRVYLGFEGSSRPQYYLEYQ